ncbi:MAG: thiamine phosphate synthase, partial [Acidobacteriota bacterium]
MAFRPHRFYPVTDDRRTASHRDQVSEVVGAGARLVQIRDKRLPDGDLLEELDAGMACCRREQALLVVNDRVDLALLSGAGGVHVGEEDLPVSDARRILGPTAVVGASSHDAASAAAAEAQGADYVAIGPVYTTGTKPDAGSAVGLAAVREVRAAVRIPVVAIGGITLERAAEVLDAGADSVAVIGDLSGHPTPGLRAAAFASRLDAEPRERGLVFLTGFMGSGKTSVGRRLSERLGRRFVDLDGWIEEMEGG